MSTVAPITFGRVLKVNAPESIVNKIVNIANSDQNSGLAKDIKRAFSDKGQSKVRKYKVSKNEIYIISGEDARVDDVNYMKSKSDSAYHELMYSYVRLHRDRKEMTVAHNGKTVKAIDITI